MPLGPFFEEVAEKTEWVLDCLDRTAIIPVLGDSDAPGEVVTLDFTNGPEDVEFHSVIPQYDQEELPMGILASTEESTGRVFELTAVDHDMLNDSLRECLGALMAQAYLFGRFDQVADMEGSNVMRVVKARDLGKIIDLSMFTGDELLFESKAEFLKMFTNCRGILRKAGILTEGVPE